MDKELLALKTNVIEAEAHIGPIAYIATAFGLDSDNATKYLIYLIIFAFDPMAIALTLATNNALRLRKEEKEEDDRRDHEERMRKMQIEHEERLMAERFAKEELAEVGTPLTAVAPIANAEKEEIVTEEINNSPVSEVNNTHEEPVVEEPVVEEPVVEEDRETELNTKPPAVDLPPPQQRHYRPYAGLWNGDAADIDTKLNELVSHYNWLKQRRGVGEELSRDEMWEFQAIEDVLKKHGYNIYL